MKNRDIIILSIKPVFSEAIFRNFKSIEFRKTYIPMNIKTVIIYASKPVSMVVGYFIIEKIIVDSPKNLWLTMRKKGGVNKESFFKYYKNCEMGLGIVIKQSYRLKRPLQLEQFNIRPPQSFQYAPEDLICNIFKNS